VGWREDCKHEFNSDFSYTSFGMILDWDSRYIKIKAKTVFVFCC